MNRLFYAFTSLFLSCLFLVSCNSGPSASSHAKKFCDCSPDFAKATVQYQAKTIDEATFRQVAADHALCMGDEDPLELLKDQPKKLMEFKANFLTELQNQCPEIARNLGY